MDETDRDRELRNIKLAQFQLRPILSNVLNGNYSSEGEQLFAFDERKRICDIDDDEPSSKQTREQPPIIRESLLCLHQTTANDSSQYPKSQPSHCNDNDDDDDDDDVADEEVDSKKANNNHVKRLSASSIELQKRVINHCFKEHSQSLLHHSSSRSNCDSSQSNNNDRTNTKNFHFYHIEREETFVPLKGGDDDQEQNSLIKTVSNRTQQLNHSISKSSSTSPITNVVSKPGAFLMRGSTITGQAQKGIITLCDNNTNTISSDNKVEEEQFVSSSLLSVESSGDEEKKKKYLRLFMIGISFLIAILIVVVVAVVVPTILLDTKSARENSSEGFKHWSDLLIECNREGEIDPLSMIDSCDCNKISRFATTICTE